MLVLSRKTGERILIGDQITLTVVRIGPNNVRIGIEAPRDLNIVREELCAPHAAPHAVAGLSSAHPSDAHPVHAGG